MSKYVIIGEKKKSWKLDSYLFVYANAISTQVQKHWL